ncbi:uncharacterized protein LOC110730662 isoform X1 [Chenopodium quinoa]|uniref:uncharacterized protein LOC110730662 isoform X1 n=1 Tax=Chenopodium quinoa TaxID=63459 RepID=UPI000B797863|nr:uncharacterized protein LOC110730662 isoform X1 [Chenopodium quinoa]XP_021766168.1 uncharacterized protein LOC110730662 isoform X1 [Chenopodium quinoa]
MSYPGSQQQFGLSDLQLLQQQLMLARLQELQKQQQLGQLGDGKPSSSLNMPLYAKHTAGGQIPSGAAFNASNMVAASNLNWMHHNGSSSMPGINQGSAYSHGEGLIMNSALQQPDSSYYGTPISSGRGNLGHYSSLQGVPYSSVYTLSVNSNDKLVSPLSAFTNPFMGDKPSASPGQGHSIDGSFMLRQGVQEKGLAGQVSAQMISSGMSLKNFPPVKANASLKAYDRADGQCNVSRFLHEQTKQTNGSQGTATLDPLEEKILFDTEDDGWDTSFSKLAAIDSTDLMDASSHKNYMDSYSSIHSGSWSALMQSAVAEASSSDTGIQEELSGLSFQNSDSCIRKQPINLTSNDQQHGRWIDSGLKSSSNNPRGPLSSVDSVLINRSVPAEHPVNHWTVMNDKNSRDLSQGSWTSAVSRSGMMRNDFDCHSYVPVNNVTDQKDYINMGLDHQSSSNPMAVNALYKKAAEIYGNQNHYRRENSSDSYNSKVSQAYVAQADNGCLNAEDSESSARSSHKSQNQVLCVSSPGANSQQECFSPLKSNDVFRTDTDDTTMKGKPNLSGDAFSKGSPASDISASFDSQNTSEPKISVSHGDANPERFSFQSSVPGDSRIASLGSDKGQTWWTPSSLGNSFSPLQGASLSQGHLHVDSQLDGKHISKVSDTYESIRRKFPGMNQQISSSGFSTTQDGYPLNARALPVTQLTAIQGMYCQGEKPLNVWRDVPSQKDMIELSSLAGLPSRMSKDNHDEQNISNIQTVNFHKGHESSDKYLIISADASASAGSCINHRGYVNSGFSQKISSETTLKALSTYGKSQLLHNAGLQSLHEIHELAKATAGSQFDSCSSGNNFIPSLSSGLNRSMKEISSESSALQYINPDKVPVFAQGYSNGNIILSDRINHMQNEYMQTRQILSQCAAQTANKASENVQLSGTITDLNGIPASRKLGILPSLANQMVTCEQSLPSSVHHMDATINLGVRRIKKRKSAMYECLPWHKEVMKTCQVLPDISNADQEWTEVTNRLMKKECVDEDERNDKMRPALRAKRRLISTTKLMQLVFRPPPSTVLSVDASVEYEIVTYSTTKLALSDACSLANRTRTDCNMSQEFGNMNRNGRMVDCLSDKATELFKRTKELETHMERLIKGISVVDILVQCQELEKFCHINHYARYHSRVPDPVAANSESSPTGVASVKPFLQRYVSAVPLPLKLPEGVQCLSL